MTAVPGRLSQDVSFASMRPDTVTSGIFDAVENQLRRNEPSACRAKSAEQSAQRRDENASVLTSATRSDRHNRFWQKNRNYPHSLTSDGDLG